MAAWFADLGGCCNSELSRQMFQIHGISRDSGCLRFMVSRFLSVMFSFQMLLMKVKPESCVWYNGIF